MRILSVRQPWAWAIVHGGKDVENRPRNLAGEYRGLVAIHASLRWADDGDEVMMTPGQVASAIEAKGHIIGVVDLVDVHFAQAHRGCYVEADVLGWVPWDGVDAIEDGVIRPRFCSAWGEHEGPLAAPVAHLVLENPRPLAVPIPHRGMLGLQKASPELEAQITKALAA